MEERIVKYIQKHRLLTLATSASGIPYCCNVFQVFDSKSAIFYFMSSAETKHIRDAQKQRQVAGTIVSENLNIARIQGIQFSGKFFQPQGTILDGAKKLYLKKFPVANFFNSNVWGIEIDFIKMTDNTLGFGKKIVWSRAEDEKTKDEFLHVVPAE